MQGLAAILPLDIRIMYKNIRFVAFPADEAVPFIVIEPLHCPRFFAISVQLSLSFGLGFNGTAERSPFLITHIWFAAPLDQAPSISAWRVHLAPL